MRNSLALVKPNTKMFVLIIEKGCNFTDPEYRWSGARFLSTVKCRRHWANIPVLSISFPISAVCTDKTQILPTLLQKQLCGIYLRNWQYRTRNTSGKIFCILLLKSETVCKVSATKKLRLFILNQATLALKFNKRRKSVCDKKILGGLRNSYSPPPVSHFLYLFDLPLQSQFRLYLFTV